MLNIVVRFAIAVGVGFYTIEAGTLRSLLPRIARFGLGLCCLVICGQSKVLAETTHAGWDCVQDKQSGEWLCKTDRSRQREAAKAAEKEALESDTEPSPESLPLEKQGSSPLAEDQTPETRPPTATLHKEDGPAKPTLTEGAPQKEPDFDELSKDELGVENLAEPLPSLAKQPGWTCKSDAGDTGWNCSLVGPDPAGQAHPVSTENESVVGTATFNNRHELIFRDMLTKIPYDPWDKCTTGLGPRPLRVSKEERKKAPVNVNADYSDVYEREVITLTGNVDVTRADQRVLADQASYNRESETLSARGNVHYRDQDYSVYSDTAFIKLDSDQGKLRNSQFIYGAIPARGRAAIAEREDIYRSNYIDAAYTTCAPGNQDWTLETGTLDVDREEGIAAATNAWLEISGVPIMYVPYFEFPIDDRRKSGILNPVFGVTRNTGFDFTLPYYWNIAPNYDATFVPRIMSKRGLLLGGEFRYLTESSFGRFRGQLLPYDTKAKKTRGSVSFLDSTTFTSSLRSKLDLNWISDRNYLNEISNTIALTRFSHIRSTASLLYTGPIRISTLFENYQTIDPTIPPSQRPYRRLPQLLVTGAQKIPGTDLRGAFRGEQVFFFRNNTVNGHRTNLRPDISWPFETAGAFVTPKVALDYTQYFLNNQAANTPGSISRVLPLISLDSGLFFERDFNFGGTQLIQTLEPRMYYLYVPYKNQDDIPLFDTSANDFTLLQFFRDNRFNNPDRLGDANQLSFAVTSRILEPDSGLQRLDGTLGTIVYFNDRRVQLSPGLPAETNRTSTLVGELNGVVSDTLSFRSGLQWDPYVGTLTRGLFSLHYQDPENRILNLDYRYRQLVPPGITQIEIADGSFRWPLFKNFAGIGRMQYSIHDRRVLESFLGFEKESCCWRLRLIGRYWIQSFLTNPGAIVSNVNANGRANTGIFLQLEFKGFASFGDNVDKFLERNISGYRGIE